MRQQWCSKTGYCSGMATSKNVWCFSKISVTHISWTSVTSLFSSKQVTSITKKSRFQLTIPMIRMPVLNCTKVRTWMRAREQRFTETSHSTLHLKIGQLVTNMFSRYGLDKCLKQRTVVTWRNNSSKTSSQSSDHAWSSTKNAATSPERSLRILSITSGIRTRTSKSKEKEVKSDS